MKGLFGAFLMTCFLTQIAVAQTSIVYTIDSLLQTQFKATEPGGVVLVAKKDAVIYKKAFGMANVEMGVPTNDSMVFYIGSNTKQFTAVAILQLVEKGQLKLEDSLGKFFPLLPAPVDRITVRQLLSQTSGIDEKSEKDIKTLLSAGKPQTASRIAIAPGTKWEYNNTNYSILGNVIEKTTGKPYAEYIREHIFQPAGMAYSFVDNEVSNIPNRASGYRNFKNKFQPSTPNGKIGAAGGIQSTVTDLLLWNSALKKSLLLKEETLQQAFSPQALADGSLTGYGFGWYLEELHGSATRRHGGMVPGYTAETLYLPAEDVYVVFLTNTEFTTIPITALSRIVAGLAIGKPYLFTSLPINRSTLKNYTGLYQNEAGEQLNISVVNEGLVFQRPNGAPYKLGYAGGHEFFLPQNFLRVNFVAGANGSIKGLKFSKVDVGVTEWAKTGRPLLKLSPERLADSVLQRYEGKYTSPGGDSVVVMRDGPNLYLKKGNAEVLLAATDSTHFFGLEGDLRIRFIKEGVTSDVVLVMKEKGREVRYKSEP